MNRKIIFTFFACQCFLLTCLVSLCMYSIITKNSTANTQKEKSQLAKILLLTDLCLSTESRHVRHLSTPEYIAPFQDFPAYHEHFPSSSFLQTIIKKE
jgi:hypothetical protein